MNVAKRTKKLRALLDIRIGPGALIFPNDVKRIHLDFAHKFNDGHLGARRVWRKYLPRLKYHNPAVSMTVNRHSNQAGPSTLTIFSASPPKGGDPTITSTSNSPTDLPIKALGQETGIRTEVVDIKYKSESDILSKLAQVTNGVPYQATEREMAELEDVKEDDRRSERDKERQIKFNEIKRQEAALLEQARGSS